MTEGDIVGVTCEIRQNFETEVFKTLIRNNVRLREAASHGLPITEYEPKSNGALDFGMLSEEVIALESESQQSDAVLAGKQVPVVGRESYIEVGAFDKNIKEILQ